MIRTSSFADYLEGEERYWLPKSFDLCCAVCGKEAFYGASYNFLLKDHSLIVNEVLYCIPSIHHTCRDIASLCPLGLE